MAKKSNSGEVQTLEDFTHLVSSYSSEYNEPIWFRGVGNIKFPLIPSLFRKNGIDNEESIREIEVRIMSIFKERALPHLKFPCANDWEWLFLMQHHGVPTRLLDWTENPFIALYFALSSACKIDDAERGDAGVWLLRPLAWNAKYSMGTGNRRRIISVIETESVAGYTPMDARSISPVAISAYHNSSRIIAQRGSFILFGTQVTPLDTLCADSTDADKKTLVKAVIPKESIHSLLSQLHNIGYTESAIFPDLDGLARDIRRIHSFGA
jgi:FRG domain.